MAEIPDEVFEDWFQHYRDFPWDGERFEIVMAHNRMKLYGKANHHTLYPHLWKEHEYEAGILGDDGKRRYRNQRMGRGEAKLLIGEFSRLKQQAVARQAATAKQQATE